MNSRFPFVLCSVLTVCLSVSAADNQGTEVANDKAIHECLGQYLSNKGILNYEGQAYKESPLCHSTISLLGQSYRDEFRIKVRSQYPNEADCIMSVFDETKLAELILTVAFYQTAGDDSFYESEKKILLRALKTEGDKKMNKMTSKCRVEGELFQNFMFAVFSTSSGESIV